MNPPSLPPTTKSAPPAAPAAPPKAPPSPRATPATSRTREAKTFSISRWDNSSEGEKIVLYGKSGIGKSTLASMAPGAVFIGIDDGGRQIVHPKTGERLRKIDGVESHADLRDAISQVPSLLSTGETLVIDTVTKAEANFNQHIIETVKTSSGQNVSNFRQYGWDGDRHVLDCGRELMGDLDLIVRKGINVVLLSQLGQIKVANAEGLDYLEDGPKLQHRNDCSFRTELIEWSDHCFRIGYLDFAVTKDDAKAKAGKVSSSDATRAVFTGGAQHFIAKSRPVSKNRQTPYTVPSVISFGDQADDSLWLYVFGGAVAPE